MKDDERRTYGLVWTALRWAAAALQQADRVRAAWEPYMATMRPPPGGSFYRRETPETQRPNAHFWADVHFLMISVRHLGLALERIDDGPRLSKATSEKAKDLRNLVEHWRKAETGGGAWKGLRERHGEYADPRQLMFDPPDFKIGPDSLSVADLADDVRRVDRELTALELKLG
jgi:hypothetical protein